MEVLVPVFVVLRVVAQSPIIQFHYVNAINDQRIMAGNARQRL
jgi:hypothetical protein